MISVQCKYCLRMCDVAVDLQQIKEWIGRGDLIQDFFPDLSAEDEKFSSVKHATSVGKNCSPRSMKRRKSSHSSAY